VNRSYRMTITHDEREAYSLYRELEPEQGNLPPTSLTLLNDVLGRHHHGRRRLLVQFKGLRGVLPLLGGGEPLTNLDDSSCGSEHNEHRAGGGPYSSVPEERHLYLAT